MPGFTSWYNLTLPTVGADAVEWATWTNNNWTLVDAALHAHDLTLAVHTAQLASIAPIATVEGVQDIVGAMVQNGTEITWTYNDALGTLTPSIPNGSIAPAKLSGHAVAFLIGNDGPGAPRIVESFEVVNDLLPVFASGNNGVVPDPGASPSTWVLTVAGWAAPSGGGGTPEEIQDLVGAMMAPLPGFTAEYLDPSAQIQIGFNATWLGLSVLGVPSAGTSTPSAIPASANNQVLRRADDAVGFGTLHGDAIENQTVALNRLAPITADRILGRQSGGTGEVELLTPTQAATMLGVPTLEQIQDVVGVMLEPEEGIQGSYNEGPGTFTLSLNPLGWQYFELEDGMAVLGCAAGAGSMTPIIAGGDYDVLHAVPGASALGFGKLSYKSTTGGLTRGQAVALAAGVY